MNNIQFIFFILIWIVLVLHILVFITKRLDYRFANKSDYHLLFYSSFCSIIYILIIFFSFILLCKGISFIENKQIEKEPPIIVERDISPIPYDDLGEFTISFYCDCPICTKTAKGRKTATGVKPKEDITIACDGDILKMGDIVYIENIGVYICQDKGSAITNGRIDVFVNNHQEAVNLGVKKARVYKIGG